MSNKTRRETDADWRRLGDVVVKCDGCLSDERRVVDEAEMLDQTKDAQTSSRCKVNVDLYSASSCRTSKALRYGPRVTRGSQFLQRVGYYADGCISHGPVCLSVRLSVLRHTLVLCRDE